MRRRDRLAFWSLLLLAFTARAAEGLRPFDQTSYATIIAEHRDRPFVLAFWSLDCPPCHRELAGLGRWLTGHPDTALVLVSTDENPGEEALEVLRKHDLQAADNWAMTMPFDTPVRFTIDPMWYGELPRTYLFDADHQRQSFSGVLAEHTLELWQETNARTSNR